MQGIPAPAPVPINPTRFAALAAIIVAGLLLLQYAHRRKLFILIWAAGWLLIAPAMLLIARGYDSAIAGNAAVGLSQFLGVCTAATFLWGADAYRQTGFVRGAPLRYAAVVAVYFLIAPVIGGPVMVLGPGYALSAIVMGAAGAMYAAILIERRIIGAGLIAVVMFGLGVSNVATAYLMPRLDAGGQTTFQILLINSVLYTFGVLGVHMMIFEDMTYELRMTNRRLESAREELLQAAITDPLTGCHNRRFLEQVQDRELQRHKRFKLPMSLLFIDIDRFKAINDTLGHDTGDRVLQYVARFLKRNIREADYIFRWGGDEFLVLITCNGEEAKRKATMLKSNFDAAPEAVELPPGIGLSAGSIEVPPGAKDLMPLIAEADALMYVDKQR
ncbi:MAG TPA: GGDEF domain-containing protein [Vicinamibacterales bacterium]|nr:GGDEF domain-containing protein [Vicinamibacterales bacterium]